MNEELDDSTVAKLATVQNEDGREVTRNVKHVICNLHMITRILKD